VIYNVKSEESTDQVRPMTNEVRNGQATTDEVVVSGTVYV